GNQVNAAHQDAAGALVQLKQALLDSDGDPKRLGVREETRHHCRADSQGGQSRGYARFTSRIRSRLSGFANCVSWRLITRGAPASASLAPPRPIPRHPADRVAESRRRTFPGAAQAGRRTATEGTPPSAVSMLPCHLQHWVRTLVTATE